MSIGSYSSSYSGSHQTWWKYAGGGYSYQSTTGTGNRGHKTWNGADAGKRPENGQPNTWFNTQVRDRIDGNGDLSAKALSLGLNQLKLTSDRKFAKGGNRRSRNRAPKAYYMESSRFTNPMTTAYASLRTNGTLVWEIKDVYPQNSVVGLFGELLPPAPPNFDANDQIKLVGKLSESIRGTDFNMSVFLGEGHQTLRLIGDSAFRIANSYRSFRKGDIRNGVRWLFEGTKRKPPSPGILRPEANALASNWLAVQYGVIPLLNDMKSGAELLAHQLSVPFRRRYVARISKRNDVQPWTPVRATKYICMRYRQLIAYVSEAPTPVQLSGILDPELVAWELIPFSFVADWALPIGDYLSARAAASKLSGLYVTTEISRRHASGIVPKAGPNMYTFEDPGYSGEVVNMARSVSTTLSVPLPNVKSLAQIGSWQHCANGLALLQTVFRGR